MGLIYKITNLVNGKSYIGQTKYDLEQRLKKHMREANSLTSEYKTLYMAFKKYGIQNFKAEVLEECNQEDLDARESYWIQYYDSYNSGYNMTLGGSGFKKYNLDEEKIISAYKNNGSMRKIAAELGVATNVISAILHKNKVEITTKIDNTEVGLIQLDKELNIKNYFDSVYQAYNWAVLNYKSDIKSRPSIIM